MKKTFMLVTAATVMALSAGMSLAQEKNSW